MSNDHAGLCLLSLPDDVVHCILSYLDPQGLCRIETVCLYLKGVDTTVQWQTCCDVDFSTYPRYNCKTNGYPTVSFKQAYEWLKKETTRSKIGHNDLESLNWYFNFHPRAGGMGRDSLVRCKFARRVLQLTGYPPLDYFIEEDGACLFISNFPPHFVSRLPDGEWLVKNENVTFVSCDDRGTLNYRGRGFQ